MYSSACIIYFMYLHLYYISSSLSLVITNVAYKVPQTASTSLIYEENFKDIYDGYDQT